MENKTTTPANAAIDKAMEEIRRINCKNVGDFNPSCFMIQLENGSLYLEVKYRIAWFRITFPNGVIETEIVRVDNDGVLFKATIYKEQGVVLANGYGHEWLNSDFDPFACAETRAIGQALVQAGFGTAADAKLSAVQERHIELIERHIELTKENKALTSSLESLKSIEKLFWSLYF